ncbi:MAG: hypothetical protein ACHQU8_03675 [Gemmatimonadales bacterium]
MRRALAKDGKLDTADLVKSALAFLGKH